MVNCINSNRRDGRTDRQTDRRDGRTDRQTDRRDGRTGRTDRRTGRRDGRTDRQTDRRTNEQTDGATAVPGERQKEQLMTLGRAGRADYRAMPPGTVGQINDTDRQTDGHTRGTNGAADRTELGEIQY